MENCIFIFFIKKNKFVLIIAPGLKFAVGFGNII